MVERVTGHRHEDRRNAERVAVRVLKDVGRTRDVPAGVATGLERVAQPTAGEARCVGLALGQCLAGELGQRRAVACRFKEAVVLLSGKAGQWVEDVRVVSRALLHRPVLHGGGNRVSDERVERRRVLDRRHHRLENRLRQPLLHDDLAEDVLAEDLPGCLGRQVADGRRDVGLDVFDGLKSNVVAAHEDTLRTALAFPAAKPDAVTLGVPRIGGVSSM